MADTVRIIARRTVAGVISVFVLLIVVFFLARLAGDPVTVIAGPEAGPEQVEQIRRNLGLDQPVWRQLWDYVRGLFVGDLGTSWRTGEPALGMVLSRLPATLELAAAAMVLATVIAIPVGVLSAVRPGSAIDAVARFGAVLGQSIPAFWLGILMIVLFAVTLGWLPTGGHGSWEHVVLPGVTLSVYSIPLTMRVTRSAMLETLGEDYIRTARSKGLSERRVMVRHALRNAMLPVITVLALRTGHVLTGSLVLEQVFAYPGVSRAAVQAIQFRDFPVLQVFVILVALLVITTNLVADLLYTTADPRVRIN